MITVSEARALLFDLAGPLGTEEVLLEQAAGRVLATPVTARRDQPPFAASSMDGYAVNATEVEQHAMFKVIGEAAAGHRFPGRVGPGQAVRIFTGAPMPEGADFVVIQEDTSRSEDLVTITSDPGSKSNVRPAAVDFVSGATIRAPRLLRPEDIALLAAMNVPTVTVTRKPVVALMSTGDELVMPGDTPGPDQIIVSNTFGLQALLQAHGADCRMLPIARDTLESLRAGFELAKGADLIITIGGASVGDHDLVAEATEGLGMQRSFYKVLMRPGKPLMAGKLDGSTMVGLPGNPVSAMVCGYIFILPLLRSMLGLGRAAPLQTGAVLAGGIAANGPREHYMRATVRDGKLTVAADQDSSLLSVLAESNALLVRAPNEPALQAGTKVRYVPI